MPSKRFSAHNRVSSSGEVARSFRALILQNISTVVSARLLTSLYTYYGMVHSVHLITQYLLLDTLNFALSWASVVLCMMSSTSQSFEQMSSHLLMLTAITNS